MGSINRATLPQAFLDSVSLGMRLPTPEPQYFFARMAMAGRIGTAALAAGARTAAAYVLEGAGGAPVPQELDALSRTADIYPGAVLTIDDFKKNAGDTIKLRRDIFEGGGYSEADREVVQGKPTSTTGQGVKMEEVPVVLKQFEGPWHSASGEIRPYAIQEFDAQYRAKKDDLVSLTQRHLRRDYVKWLDTVVRDRFRASGSIAPTLPGGVSDVTGFTAGAGHIVSLEQIFEARHALSGPGREWQPFAGGRYLLIVPTVFNGQMLGDPDYRELSKNKDQSRNLIFGYITTIQDIDIVECSTLKVYSAGETVPGTNGGVVPAGATVHEALLIGPGGVGVGTAQDPTAYYADDTDFGKSAKVIWRSTQAFETTDNRAVQRLLFQTGS